MSEKEGIDTLANSWMLILLISNIIICLFNWISNFAAIFCSQNGFGFNYVEMNESVCLPLLSKGPLSSHSFHRMTFHIKVILAPGFLHNYLFVSGPSLVNLPIFISSLWTEVKLSFCISHLFIKLAKKSTCFHTELSDDKARITRNILGTKKYFNAMYK